MDLPDAIKNLEGTPSFEAVVDLAKDQRDAHVVELSDMKNAGNPQLLAYLAGSISALDILIRNIDECRTPSN